MNQELIDIFRDRPIPDQGLLIDGQWAAAASGQSLPVVSPIDGQTLGNLAAAGQADVDRAVQSARRSFEQGVWSRMAPAERKKVLHRIADRIEAHHAELAVLGVRDNGTEIAMAWKA
ncbi:MAG: aldehyde dehydrogenase family protein, partial [Burkholderiaceae bacterium]